MHIPLKVTTEYTLLSSLITLDNLIACIKKNNVNICGICDKNMLGTNMFYRKCKENNIKPIIGLEINISDSVIYVYAKNYEGYKNLLNIDYIMQEREISLLDLSKYSNNLIFVVPYKYRSIAKELRKYNLYISY